MLATLSRVAIATATSVHAEPLRTDSPNLGSEKERDRQQWENTGMASPYLFDIFMPWATHTCSFSLHIYIYILPTRTEKCLGPRVTYNMGNARVLLGEADTAYSVGSIARSRHSSFAYVHKIRCRLGFKLNIYNREPCPSQGQR